jgi:hypothetical protein
MNFNNHHNNSTFTMRVMCAIVFSAFTFLFLFYFQADVLAAAQHVLSDGMTHYNRLVGAILITLVLQLLQLGIFSLVRLSKRSHAITYFPSCLCLAFITDICPDIDGGYSMGAWAWLIPLLLVVFVGVLYAAKAFQPYEPENISQGLFSRCTWINILTLNLFFVFVGLSSNGNDLMHYRTRIESCLLDNDYASALNVGEKSDDADASLTMLRVYAMSRVGTLGDKLFAYPVDGGSKSLLPSSKADCLMYPSDSIYRYLGAVPKQQLEPMDYLLLLRKRHKMNRCAVDYLLCGYLLDRQVDSFVKELRKYYKIDEHLPKYYREALTLYTHLRTNPALVFHSPVMDADYQDFTDWEHKYTNSTERRSAVIDSYSDTYWCYYYYGCH